MKFTIGQKRTLITLILALFVTQNGFTQDPLLEETDQILNSDQIDIDGLYQQRKESAADRLAKARKQLEQQNEQMVQKKIEDIRIREEQKLTNKLRKAFNGGGLNDTVSTQQAAPVAKAEAPKVEEKKTNKIFPTLGVLNILKGDSNVIEDDLDATLNFGIGFESEVAENIAVGFRFNYAKVDLQDEADQLTFNDLSNPFFSGGAIPLNGGSFNNPNQGRDMRYNRFDLEVNGKYYFTQSKLRPYAGLGLGYSRTSLDYESDRNSANNVICDGFQCYNLNDDDNDSYRAGFISGTVMAGAEFSFSETMGLNFDIRYTKPFNAGNNNDNDDNDQTQSFTNTYDEDRLETIGAELDDSDVFALTLGVVFKF